jgi:hypothetical protein
VRHLAVTLLVATLVVVAGCGGDDPSEGVPDGARAQAIERLEAFGLPRDQATCIADELGADTVLESGDILALTAGGEYRQAAEGCIGAS